MPLIGIRHACRAVGRSRATHYRSLVPALVVAAGQVTEVAVRAPQVQPRALSIAERDAVLVVLRSEKFVDKAPGEIHAILLDEGTYLCSVSTMYRLLRETGEVGERRAQATHPARIKPELVATGPNRVWSWDISKLMGPAKWTYFHLYCVIDIYSRYVIGWMVATRESAQLAEQLLLDTIRKQNIDRDTLTIHADNGSSMASKPVAFLLADLGVTKSHSRPHTNNDNPFSESNFKTLKYRPDFPKNFTSLEHAKAHCADFFRWYNTDHRHLGIGMHTPSNVHHGRAAAIQLSRAAVLTTAYGANPERFVRHPPKPPSFPTTSWINEPKDEEEIPNSLKV